MSNDDSYIKTSADGDIAFVGRDAVALFRATALRSGIDMYARSRIKPNSAWTPTAMLKAAGEITGKTYRRGEYAQASLDLRIWIDTMKAGLAVVRS